MPAFCTRMSIAPKRVHRGGDGVARVLLGRDIRSDKRRLRQPIGECLTRCLQHVGDHDRAAFASERLRDRAADAQRCAEHQRRPAREPRRQVTHPLVPCRKRYTIGFRYILYRSIHGNCRLHGALELRTGAVRLAWVKAVRSMKSTPDRYRGFRFPAETISHAVWRRCHGIGSRASRRSGPASCWR